MTANTYFRMTLLLCLLCSAACTGNFEEINRNKYQVTREELERENYNIGSTLRGLQGMVIPAQEHLNQFFEALAGGSFGGYMEATADGWKDKFSTYNPPSNWLRAPFVDVISETYPYYRDMLSQTDDPVALALAKLLRVAIMHRVTDTFGPIPYSKVVEDTQESLQVPYDSQRDIYMRMFAELDEVAGVLRANLSLDSEAFRKFDNVYFGDISKWLKFCNSFKLRMAMRIAYVEPALAQQYAEQAVADGVITDNAANARFWVEENRTAMMYNDWNDHRVGADIISYMNGFKDPRREKMFTKGTYFLVSDFFGLRIGIDPTRTKEVLATAYSKPLITSKDPFLWMNAAEVAFLRAEGALRGWAMGGVAGELYEAAITLSFEERGATGAAAYILDATSTPQRYMDPLEVFSAPAATSTITIKWQPTATFEQNLERIITQKWIAVFPLGIEAWSEFRRTGYPKLLPVVANKSGGVINSDRMIRRLPYPAEEYADNNANLQQAIVLLGGPDNGATRLWWDVKPY